MQAKDDYEFVEWVLKGGMFFDKGCFIAQQSGEKALKACLYATGKRRVIGHSLFEMANELVENEKTFQEIMNETRRLDRFYIPTRYPNGLPGGSPFQIYTERDLTEAFKDLKKVIDLAYKHLEKSEVIY